MFILPRPGGAKKYISDGKIFEYAIDKKKYTSNGVIFESTGSVKTVTHSLIFDISWTKIKPAQYYNRTIHYPVTADQDLLDAVNDAKEALQNITGQTFTPTTIYTESSIKLLLVGDENMSQTDTSWLTGKGREAFTIRNTDQTALTICANRVEGLRQGLYYYLQKIGVRYYAPDTTAFSSNSADWNHFPSTNDITLTINEEKIADFPDTRNFFGTGGFGGKTVVDPTIAMKDVWDLHRRRNMYGGNIKVSGHEGESYNLFFKDFLEENPEFMAEVDGIYGPWSATVKINVANPAAVQKFVDFLMGKYETRYNADPDQISAWAQSVEPADGSRHPNSLESLTAPYGGTAKYLNNGVIYEERGHQKYIINGQIFNEDTTIGSISDQVFYVANKAADEIKEINDQAYVTLFGYNDHAGVPGIDLKDNIYIQLIPYAFQKTGLSPIQLIKKWALKIARMGIYDYWTIPDWGNDLPSFTCDDVYEKLSLWKDNNIKGVNTESTYSHGAMGLPHLVASRLMWDITADKEYIQEEYFDLMFGEAKAPIKNMYNRWSIRYMPSTHDLALSYRDLQDAIALTSDAKILKRLGDLGRYVRYLDLFINWDILPNGAEKDAANEAIVRYALDIYYSCMIHADRRVDLQTVGYPELKAEYLPLMPPDEGIGWADVTELTQSEIFDYIDQGVIDYEPIDFEPTTYTVELVPTGQTPVDPPATNPMIRINGSFNYIIQTIAGQDVYALGHKHSEGKKYTVRLVSEAGDILEVAEFTGNDSWRQYNIPIPGEGQYTLDFQNLGNTYLWIDVPNDVYMSLSDWRSVSPFAAPPMYFWVPEGHEKFALFRKYPNVAYTIKDSTGTVLTQTSYDNGRITTVDVPSGQDGKIWTLNGIISPNDTIEMLTAPQSFSLHQRTLIVPNDSL